MDFLSKQPLKGMEDVTPDEMYTSLWMEKIFNDIANRFSYETYSTPILEPMEMYLRKSSRELIEEQAYHLTDKGERQLVLRPEITPSLARMVSNYYLEKPKPFRLYTIGLCYRYERPQKGRQREFRQINFDFLGGDTREMDVEIALLVKTIMSCFGVKDNEFQIRYNFRSVLNAFLKSLNASNPQAVLQLIDRKDKMSAEDFDKELNSQLPPSVAEALRSYFEYNDILLFMNKHLPHETELIREVTFFLETTRTLGLNQVLHYSPTTVRGLDYYTGFVFEVYDTSAEIRRALFGGGRYDGLLQNYAKDNMEACGFAIGFEIFTLFLKDRGLIPQQLKPATCRLYYLDEEALPFAYQSMLFIQNKYHLRVTLKRHTGNIQKLFNKLEPQDTHLVIIGSNELSTRTFVIKDLKNKDETSHTL